MDKRGNMFGEKICISYNIDRSNSTSQGEFFGAKTIKLYYIERV